MFAVEFLPGQFDQRADSAAQCIQMLCPGERPVVKYAKIYVLKGKISDDEFARIKHYLINAVESRECGFDKYDTLEVKYTIPTSVETLTGFINKTDAELADFVVHTTALQWTTTISSSVRITSRASTAIRPSLRSA